MDKGVIRRKLTGAQAVAAPLTGGAEKAWPLALARAAQDRAALMLDCGPVKAQRLSLTELLDLTPDRALIALLDGPKEAQGVLMMAPEVLASVIEAQTLGRVLSSPVAPRKPTRTDAAMVADLIDAALQDLEQALLAEEDLVWTDGFRYASFLDEPRPLALMLEDTAWKVLRCSCDLGGARRGDLVLALPAEGHGRRPHRAAVPPPPDPAAADPFTQDLAQQVLGAEAELTAVLGRLRLPLSAALGLAVGDVLPLGPSQVDAVELVGKDGRPVAVGKLGQCRGQRAIRLADPGPATALRVMTEPLARPAVPEPVAPPGRLAATG